MLALKVYDTFESLCSLRFSDIWCLESRIGSVCKQIPWDGVLIVYAVKMLKSYGVYWFLIPCFFSSSISACLVLSYVLFSSFEVVLLYSVFNLHFFFAAFTFVVVVVLGIKGRTHLGRFENYWRFWIRWKPVNLYSPFPHFGCLEFWRINKIKTVAWHFLSYLFNALPKW